jgi:hypothetical protein
MQLTATNNLAPKTPIIYYILFIYHKQFPVAMTGSSIVLLFIAMNYLIVHCIKYYSHRIYQFHYRAYVHIFLFLISKIKIIIETRERKFDIIISCDHIV